MKILYTDIISFHRQFSVNSSSSVLGYNALNFLSSKGVTIKTVRIYALLLALFVISMLTLGFLIYKANTNLYVEDAKNSVESVLNLTQELISHKKQLALSIALMFSQNETIKEAYRDGNRERLFELINHEIHTTKQYLQMEHLEVQLHTKDAKTWVRSWDFESYGSELATWRKGIALLHQDKIPLVAVELGKRLNIKALAPIFDKDKFIGSLEVIIGFEEIAQNLKDKKIDFAILMHHQFLEIGSWMKELEQINDYVVVHSSCSENCATTLYPILTETFLAQGFTRANGTLFGFTPLFDIESKPIGYIGIWFNESLLKDSLLLKATLTPHPQGLHIKTLMPSSQTPQEILIR